MWRACYSLHSNGAARCKPVGGRRATVIIRLGGSLRQPPRRGLTRSVCRRRRQGETSPCWLKRTTLGRFPCLMCHSRPARVFAVRGMSAGGHCVGLLPVRFGEWTSYPIGRLAALRVIAHDSLSAEVL